MEFQNYSELENAYVKGILHPQDLKNAVAKSLFKSWSLLENILNKIKKQRIVSKP